MDVATSRLIELLTQQGVLGRPQRADRPDAQGIARARATGSVSELVRERR